MFELKKESSDYENKSLRLPKELIEQVQSLANEYNMSFKKSGYPMYRIFT